MQRVAAVAHRYPMPLWLLAVATFVLFTARGMTLPFLIIFFGQVRGFGEGIVGFGIALNAIAGVALTLMVAGLIDKIGGRPMVIAAILGVGITTAAMPLVTTLPVFFLVMILHGMANQIYWPASDSLGTSLIDKKRVGEMFALLRVSNALGIGIGGLLGGLMVAGGSLPQYQMLYLVSGIAAILAALLVVLLVHPERDASLRTTESSSAGSWREVLADRKFMVSQGIMFLMLAGFTQMQVSMPPYLRAHAGTSEAIIGTLFAVNTMIMLGCQIPVANRIASWRRGMTLALAAAFWVAGYTLFSMSGWIAALPILAIIVFTIGEMLFLPTSGVMVVEFAPDRVRGRYLAFHSTVWGSAWGLSSWAAGMVLASSSPHLLWPVLITLIMVGGTASYLFDQRDRPQSDQMSGDLVYADTPASSGGQ